MIVIVTKMSILVVGWLCACASCLQAASAPGLRYIGEVGHLWPPFSSRRSVTLGHVEVTSEADGGLVFAGHDDDRKPWKASVPVGSGIGFTDVWQADFDRNGREDLLIAAYAPQNGRCVDRMILSFLLFNDHGQPVPWVIQSRMPADRREPATPAIFADLEHDGRLHLVVTDCSYSTPPRFGEDRSITGIYVAENATWKLIRPANIVSYTALVRRSYRFRQNHDELVATDPIQWRDLGNTMDLHGPSPVRLKGILAPSPDCRGISIPIINGRVELPANNPCDVLGRDRIELSNGAVCFGWPVVVIEGQDGREIVADPKRLQSVLQQIVTEQRTVVFAGQSNAERCGPITVSSTRQ